MNNGNGNDMTQEELRTALRRLAVATVIVYVAVVALFVVGYVFSHNQRNAIAASVETTTTALCALRNDLEVRVAASKAFLVENPEGIPGIPPRQIQDGIDNQQRTINALAVLTCPPPDLEL